MKPTKKILLIATLLCLFTTRPALAFHPCVTIRSQAQTIQLRISAPAITTIVQSRSRRDDDDDDDAKSRAPVTDLGAVGVIDRVMDFVSRPTPIQGEVGLLPDLALGFFLVLLLLPLVVPPPQALLTVALFVALRTAAVKLIVFEETSDEDPYGVVAPTPPELSDEDDSSTLSQIDAASLVLSIFAAGLLAPDATTSNDYSKNDFTVWISALPVVAAAVAGVVAWSSFLGVVEEVASEEQLSLQDKLLNKWDQTFQQQQVTTKDDETET